MAYAGELSGTPQRRRGNRAEEQDMIPRLVPTLCLLGSWLASAQAPPKFEAATIKLVPGAAPLPRYTYPPGRLSVQNATLASLIGFAYGGASGGVTGGPGWTTQDRYNVE